MDTTISKCYYAYIPRYKILQALILISLTTLNATIYFLLINKVLFHRESQYTTETNEEKRGIGISLDQLNSSAFLTGSEAPLKNHQFLSSQSTSAHYYSDGILFDGIFEDDDNPLYRIDAYGDKNNLEKVVFTGYHVEESGYYVLNLIEFTNEFLNVITLNDIDEEKWLTKLFGSTVFTNYHWPQEKVFEINNKQISFVMDENAEVGSPLFNITIEYSPVSLTLEEYIHTTAPTIELDQLSTSDNNDFLLNVKTRGLKDINITRIEFYVDGTFVNQNTQEKQVENYAHYDNIEKIQGVWDATNIIGVGGSDDPSKFLIKDSDGEIEMYFDLELFNNIHSYVSQNELELESVQVEIIDGTFDSNSFGLPIAKKEFHLLESL